MSSPISPSRMNRRKRNSGLRLRFRQIRALLLATLAATVLASLGADGQEAVGEKSAADRENSTAASRGDRPSVAKKRPPAVFLIQVPLPIAGDVDDRVRHQVEQSLQRIDEDRKRNPVAGTPARPVLVFEFGGKSAMPSDQDFAGEPPESRDGRGSQFERSLALARFLTSDRLTGVRSVAWLRDDLRGHAVLPVIACEEIIMHPDAELGEAGADESFIDATTRQSYQELASRRQTVPAPVVLGMLDRQLSVMQVQLIDEGTEYVLAERATELEQQGKVLKADRLVAAGDLASFTGRAMRLKHQWASHLAANEQELARAIGVPGGQLISSRMLAEGWKAVRGDVSGRIHTKMVNRLMRGIEDARLAGNVNLVYLWIDSPGGSLSDSKQLANYLQGLESNELRTVAFVPEQARSSAALVALACDELVVVPTAVIGGAGEGVVRAGDIDDLREALRATAERTGRGWSLPLALVQPRLEVRVYEDPETGRVQVLSEEELAEQFEPDRWHAGQTLDTRDGLTGQTLADLQIADRVVADEAELLHSYGIRPGEMEALSTRWAVSSVERLASQPWFARTVLFIAFFALISEASAPGMGVPGFVSLVCFLLFFWSQFLNGTAEWLEVSLFVGGLMALGIEFFVLPGFGVFGVGGVAMVLGSVLLASQTFVIPRSAYQFDQLAGSMFTVLTACGGTVAALVVLRRVLPHTPLFNRMMLPPPGELEAEEQDRRESISDRHYLLGQRGHTKTPLVPSGKVRFGSELVDVVSDGELIDIDTEVEVIEVRGNHVVVRVPLGPEA